MELAAQQFVDDEVPLASRRLFPSAIRRAYLAADATMERDRYFASPGGRYQRGDLIQLATSFELQQLVESGQLLFDGSWEFFAKPTGKHFVMRTARATITTSQVVDPKKKPRHAVCRANFGELNELSLIPDINEELQRKREEAAKESKRRLLHILHGYQNLNFVHLVYPHPEKNRHIYRSPNLMMIPHEVASDLPPPEGPAESPSPEALENLQRFLRDNDD